MKDRIENKSYNDTQYTRKIKKQNIISCLHKKMDLIKQELCNTILYKKSNKVVYDFEKKVRQYGNTNIVYVKNSTSLVPVFDWDTNEEISNARIKVVNSYEYMWDIKTLPIYKILKESRKLVLYYEWLYCLRENNYIKISNEIIKESKRNHILEIENKLFNEEEIHGIIQRYIDDKLRISEQIVKLNNGVQKYFEIIDTYFPYRMCLKRKNLPKKIYFLYNNKECGYTSPKASASANNSLISIPSIPPITTSGNIVNRYRKMTNIFKKCSSKTSLYSKFSKSSSSTNMHQSFSSIFKKLPGERASMNSVKDLGRVLYVRKNDVENEVSMSSENYNSDIFGQKPEDIEDFLQRQMKELQEMTEASRRREPREKVEVKDDPFIVLGPQSRFGSARTVYPFDTIHNNFISDNYSNKNMNIVENSLFVDSAKNEQNNVFAKADDVGIGNSNEHSSTSDRFSNKYTFEENGTLRK